MTIDEAFDASVAYYDDWMMKALPNYADIFSTALALLPFDPQATLEVLDLGAGTGLFSSHVLGKYPHANFVLVDLAEKNAGSGARTLRERFRPIPVRAGRLPQARGAAGVRPGHL